MYRLQLHHRYVIIKASLDLSIFLNYRQHSVLMSVHASNQNGGKPIPIIINAVCETDPYTVMGKH